MAKKFIYGTDSDLEVVGHTEEDHEEIILPVWFVTVAEISGNVYAHGIEGNAIGEEGRKNAMTTMQRLEHENSNPDTKPNDWHFWRTIYGSRAYLNEVAEMTDEERAE